MSNHNQGMKWIRASKRLAIYLRDGLACVWCGWPLELGCQLTLDHLRPRRLGGTNHPHNLVTCCRRCNCARQDRDIEAWLPLVAAYAGWAPVEIRHHLLACLERPLPLALARELLANRTLRAILEAPRAIRG